MVWLDEWSDRLELLIDNEKIDEDLPNFPTLITLGSGVGVNNFDDTGVFDALTVSGGVDSYTSLMLDPEGDRSIHRHDISFVSTPTITTISGVDCVSLDSVDEYMIVPDHSSWDLTSDFTIETWINMPTTVTTRINRLNTHGNFITTDGTWSCLIGSHASWTGIRIIAGWRITTTVINFFSDDLTDMLEIGRWHHVVWTRSAGTMRIYFDGQQVGSYSDAGAVVGAADLLIGDSPHTTTERFEGYMARIRFSDTARYTNVSTAHTLSGTNMSVSSATTGTAANLVDGSLTGGSFWEDSTSPYPAWCKYDFGSDNSQIVNRYSVSSGDSEVTRMPHTWQFQGSNNDADWDTLNSVTNELSWPTQTTRTYSFKNSTTYRYYRLYMTAGFSAGVIRLFEWSLIEGALFTPPTSYVNDEYTNLLYHVTGDKSQYKHDLSLVSAPANAWPKVIGTDPPRGDNGYWYFNPGTAPEGQISIGDHSSLDFGSGPFTIEFWFNTIQYTGDIRYIYSKRPAAGYSSVLILHNITGILTVVFTFNGTSWAHQADIFVPAGEWHHFAFTRENNTFRFFLDGIVVDSVVLVGSIYDGGQPLSIGGGDKGYWGYLQGLKVSKGISRYTTKFVPHNPPEGTSWFNRKKIQFTDVDNNKLYAEIEKWDHAKRQAWIHVNVPVVDDAVDTTLYMYYDKTRPDSSLYVGDILDTPSKTVWDSDFVGVWHMTLSDYITTKSFPDSTTHTNAGTPTATLTPIDLAEGVTTPSIYFDGTAMYIDVEDDSTLDLDTNYTLEAFFKPTADDSVDQIICKATNDSSGYQIRGDSGTGPDFWTGAGGGTVSALGRSNWQSYGWQYAAGVQTTASAILYLDGYKQDEVTSSGSPTNAAPFYIGRRWDGFYFDGYMSEIRASKTARSEAWTKATYYSLFDDLITYEQGVKPVYTASGTTTVDDLLIGGIPVRLYRRSTGELVGSTTSTVSGTFTVDSGYNEDHYVVGLYTTSGTNALIYDWISP